jgi:hypothetical protein
MDIDNLWTPEGIYCQWVGVSFLITTSSLLFYHMTRVKSLEMNSRIAGIFAIVLIISAIILGIISIIPYYTRVQYNLDYKNKNKLSKETEKLLNQENIYKSAYITLGCLVICIQIGISAVIIKGSFS